MTAPRYLLDGQGGLAPETPEAEGALGAWRGRFTLLNTAPDLLALVRSPSQGGRQEGPRVVLTGDASGFPLPDLLAFLSQSRWGGVVRVYGPDAERSITLKDGEVRGATSEDPADRLGEVLVRLGYITRAELDALLTDTPPSKVGRALVDRGRLPAHELYKCLQAQVSEIFYAMVLCKEGTFALVEPEPEEKAGASLRLSTQSLLMDSIRKIDELAHFRHRIPHGRMYVARKRSSDGKLEPEEEQLLSLISGAQTVLALGQASKLSEFDVTKVIFRLLEGGYVAVSEAPITHDAAATAPGAPRPSPERTSPGEAPSASHVASTFNRIFQEVLREVAKQGMGREFLAAANAALAGRALSPSPVLHGLTFEADGTLPEQRLVQQFEGAALQLGPDPIAALRQALSDVMFFLLFQAGELLEPSADEALARRVKELLAALE